VFKKMLWIVTALGMLVSALAGCAAPTPQIIEKQVTVEKPVIQTVLVPATPQVVEKQVTVEKSVVQTVVVTPTPAVNKAKYIFVFIGDGMGVAQRNAAELYLAATKGGSGRPEDTDLLMNTFPAQGMNTTYDLTSVIPDSASTATAISTGYKTKSGVINMDGEGKTKYTAITEVAKSKGWKVGIISSVSLDHATPAAFYAHQASRSKMYEITMEFAKSNFDYFAGGQFLKSKGADGQPDALETAKSNGFTIVTGKAGLDGLKPGVGKVLATSEMVDKDAAMYYDLDRPADQPSLADFVRKGVELLDNPTGFFMMVEGGKIDWACHANDAGASIRDTLALDSAVAEAVKFYEKHPKDTLIIVTGDHETGGMTIGFAGTQYSSFMDKIKNQKMSYIEFDKKLAEYKKTHTPENAKLTDVLPLVEQAFGLKTISAEERAALEKKVKDTQDKEASQKLGVALTELELKVLGEAFAESMKDAKIRSKDEHAYLLYGGYEPFTVKLTTILNQKSGIGWTSYSHTGVPVQTSALGVGHEAFNGYYDQTDIHKKMIKLAGF
jgi:alkaline phosphatase